MNAIERTLQTIEHKLPDRVPVDLPMAGAILAAVPTLLVYIILGRYFIRGLLAGSVKG